MYRREIGISIDKDVSGECPVARQSTQVDMGVDDVGISSIDKIGKCLRDDECNTTQNLGWSADKIEHHKKELRVIVRINACLSLRKCLVFE